MFVFNEERLKYLLAKIKLLLDEKVNKAQIAVKPAVQGTAGLTVIAAGSTPAGAQIALDDPRISDNVQVGDTVVLVDGTLSQESLTKPEKDILAELINNGGIIEFLKKKLDCDGIEIISNSEYQTRLVGQGDPLLETKLYIINDGPIAALLIDGYAKKEDINNLNDSKKDKEVAKVVDGSSLRIVTSDLNPGVGEISEDDPRIKDYVDNGDFSAGDTIDITYKGLTEENYTEEYDMAIESLKGKGLDSLLFKSDVIDDEIDDLETIEVGKALSANQGKVLKEEYLDNIKYIYINNADFTEDMSNDNTINYQVSDAPVAYGLDAEQVEMLCAAYSHTFIDTDTKYASQSEIARAKVNNKGQSFASLAERLIDIDEKLKTLLDFYN